MQWKRLVLSASAIVGFGWLAVTPLQAHHAFSSEFDANRPVKIAGTIVKVDWTNPHSWFHVDVKNPDGTVDRWMIETGGPGALTRRGFTKDYLKPGTEVVVEGYMSKGVPHRANGRVMTYPDGRTLFVGSSGTGAPEEGPES